MKGWTVPHASWIRHCRLTDWIPGDIPKSKWRPSSPKMFLVSTWSNKSRLTSLGTLASWRKGWGNSVSGRITGHRVWSSIKSVVDPGFPRGGGARGHQHTILPNFPKNCMKLKEFGPRGASFTAPLDPPLKMMAIPRLSCPRFSKVVQDPLCSNFAKFEKKVNKMSKYNASLRTLRSWIFHIYFSRHIKLSLFLDSIVHRYQRKKWLPLPDSMGLFLSFSMQFLAKFCQIIGCIGGSRGGREGRTPPPGHPNSFDFMQFSGKFGVFTPPPGGFTPPLGKILDPPLGWAPPLALAPLSGKSWIYHWLLIAQNTLPAPILIKNRHQTQILNNFEKNPKRWRIDLSRNRKKFYLVIGGSKGVPTMYAPSVQFLAFECSFRQQSCAIIGFCPKLSGWHPLWKILDPPLSGVIVILCKQCPR